MNSKEQHKLVLKPRNGAGRDLTKAIPTGIVLGVVAVLCIFVIPAGWYFLVAAAVAGGTYEVTLRLKERDYQLPLIPMLLGGQAMVWCALKFGMRGLAAAFVTSVLVIMLCRLFYHGLKQAPENFLRDTSMSVYVMCWIPLLGTFAALINQLNKDGLSGAHFVATYILCVVASDTGGYIAGVFFGKHPMAPKVSPKKSWEGFAGSIILASVVGALAMQFMIVGPWFLGVLLGVGLAICATLGDLIESQFKRDLGIKDMSNLLPGHGGIMDRVDGLLPAAMVTWLILSFVAQSWG